MSRRVVVTGAGSGLGRAFALELAKRKARLLVSDIRADAAEETASAARALGADVHAAVCDVSKPEQVEQLAKHADELFGGSDMIINNAGVAVSGSVGEITLEDWRWILDVNLWGVIYGCHAFVPRFKKQGSGHVLNVASAAGLLSAKGMAPYCVTKSGVVALSESLFLELAPRGIGVTVLCPTFFPTNIVASGRGTGDPDLRARAEAAMRKAKISAADVARIALDACDEKKLYALAGEDGRWLWRVKRLAPEAFHRKVYSFLERQVGRWVEEHS
jgi:NAD(P)-dependent dehydrogenase (short-subunit alcohol dehydrogenase family)